MLRGKGRVPVRTRRWAWFGRRAQAYTVQAPPLGQGAAPGEKVRPVRVVAEDRGALDPPHHHMVEGLGRVEPGLAWHDRVKAITT